jgi:dTDP-3,4-didehydro-2,6-dideoxy-alpha-D-glucose 3-reductase
VSHRIRYGVIGCGDAATRLFIPGLLASSKAELAAVASRSPDRGRDLAERLGCEAAYSYSELLAHDDVDVVYLGLPIALHGEWALKALEAGKHVYCEKTMAPSLEQTGEILAAARASGRRVAEGMMFRFHRLARQVRSLVHAGRIGALRSFVGSIGFTLPADDTLRRDPAMAMGVLNESGCYAVSAARLMFGAEPESVSLALRTQGAVDWSGSAWLLFGDGRAAYCEFGWNLSYRNSYSLWGEGGTLHVERAYTTPPEMEAVIRLDAGRAEAITVPAQNHFAAIVDEFAGAISSGGGHEEFEREAWRQAVTLEALRISERDGTPVPLELVARDAVHA